MTDWADEMAEKLGTSCLVADGTVRLVRPSDIANALREVSVNSWQAGRIKSFREAASMTRADCYVMADKLEKGEPNV